MQNPGPELTTQQKEHIQRLAQENKIGTLSDLAEEWGVPSQVVIRYFADCRNGGKPPERRFSPKPETPGLSLTLDQRRMVRRFADMGDASRLEGLAVKWGVPSAELRKLYREDRETILASETRIAESPKTEPAVEPPKVVEVEPVEPSPEMLAEAENMPSLPYNWPLIHARKSRDLIPKVVAGVAGLVASDYVKVEKSLMNPTVEQAVKICAFLGLPLSTFAVFAPEPIVESGPVRSLSILALLRKRRRLKVKDLGERIIEKTGVKVRISTISLIENGRLSGPLSEEHLREAQALATYFGVSVELISGQIPSAAIETAAAQIAAYHQTFRATVSQLGAGTDPILRLQAGGESS